jgi:hypothetical protein
MPETDLYFKVLKKKFKKVNKSIKKSIKNLDLTKEEKMYLKRVKHA